MTDLHSNGHNSRLPHSEAPRAAPTCESGPHLDAAPALCATAIVLGVAGGIGALLAAVSADAGLHSPPGEAALVCLLFGLASALLASNGRSVLAARSLLAAPLAAALPLLQSPIHPTALAFSACAVAGAAFAAGLLAGRREAALISIGFAASAVGMWAGRDLDEVSPLLIAGAALTVACGAMAGLALRPGFQTFLAEARRTRAMEARIAALQDENRELREYRARDFERVAGLVAMNTDLVGLQLELESNYRVMEEMNVRLERLAATDALTGLPNRRAFEEVLDAQVELSETCREPVSLLLLDVDHFKAYNDTYGHIEGDELLQELASVLREEVRDTDLAARFGGEEFTVLLPATSSDQAAAIAERLRARLQSYPFPHGGVTVSIGVATATGSGSYDRRALLTCADRALYEAKAEGRNRVVRSNESAAPALRLVSEHPSNGHSEAPTRPRARRRSDCRVHLAYVDEYGGVEGLLQQPSGTILAALLAALDLRDRETEGHSQRVARYALRLGFELTEMCRDDPAARRHYHLDPGDIRQLALGAMLHDIGKLHVPDAILRKKGPLDEAEWAIMKRHPAVGADLVSRFADLEPAATVVRFHHERWDGQGYPEGRVGRAIPLVARIFAVCDTLDAITSDRPYRAARPFSVAIEEIRNCRGKQFDPVVTDAFLQVDVREWEMIARGERPEEQRLAA